MIKALVMQPPSRGNKIAMVTNGAGPCVMAIYDEETKKKLKDELPAYCIIGNPVDLTGSATSCDYSISMEILLKDPNVDLIMPFFVFQDTPLEENIVEIIPKFQKYGKPIVCCASGGSYTTKLSKILEKKGIPVYPIPERAVAASYALITRGMQLFKKQL
jgi:3-hydroxypropionyl-CoA synthetase (ADP-forming)